MYKITRAQWDAIPEDYKLEKSIKGGRACFLCFLTEDGSGGDLLCFENEHFTIKD